MTLPVSFPITCTVCATPDTLDSNVGDPPRSILHYCKNCDHVTPHLVAWRDGVHEGWQNTAAAKAAEKLKLRS